MLTATEGAEETQGGLKLLTQNIPFKLRSRSLFYLKKIINAYFQISKRLQDQFEICIFNLKISA